MYLQFAEHSDFELITWSKDQCLRIYKIDPFLKKVSFNINTYILKKINTYAYKKHNLSFFL